MDLYLNSNTLLQSHLPKAPHPVETSGGGGVRRCGGVAAGFQVSGWLEDLAVVAIPALAFLVDNIAAVAVAVAVDVIAVLVVDIYGALVDYAVNVVAIGDSILLMLGL